jgi:hypothetical protein
MKLLQAILASVLITGGAMSLKAQPLDAPLYRNQEFSLDLVGLDILDRDRIGIGIGVNYFFERFFGVGLDGYIGDWRIGGVTDHLSLSGILRYPLERGGLSPYVLAGGGRQWEPLDRWTAHMGGGLEYRWNPTFGVFGEGRYIWGTRRDDFGLIRAGVRFTF